VPWCCSTSRGWWCCACRGRRPAERTARAADPRVGDGRGSVDAPRTTSRFDAPKAVAVDAAGEVFVSDAGGHRIRRVAVDGTVETVAGDGIAGFPDGPGAQAEFYGQEGIAVSADGKTVWVTDGNNGDGAAHHRIRLITLP